MTVIAPPTLNAKAAEHAKQFVFAVFANFALSVVAVS